MPLQHEGVDAPLLLRERAEGDGAGDVGGAVEILRPAVEQQHPTRLQGDVGLWGGLIVYDGRMLAIAGDGVEGDVAEERLLGAQRCQLLVDGYLCAA